MAPSRILVLHNRYREPGGEDHVFAQETALLRDHGHSVIEYLDTNERLDGTPPPDAALRAIWSHETVRRLERTLAATHPDIAHFHNTFLMISPAAYYVCRGADIPVIQTLHNFRLGCLNACCVRESRPCETCVSKRFAWRGIWHGCYRDSRAASAAVAAIGLVHKTLGTYRRQVDAYISTSEFARGIHVRAGVPADRSYVKPNFCFPGPAGSSQLERDFVLYAGRLVREKGVHLLIEAWRRLALPMRLKIAGDGPDAESLRAAVGGLTTVEFLGSISRERVRELMGQAAIFVQPSLMLENCGLAVVEAFAAALTCVVSGHGSFLEIVEDGRTGLHFRPGDARDLAEKLAWLIADRDRRWRMARAARSCFEERYTPARNYEQLMSIYETVLRRYEREHR